jgi:hypothetical protein
VHDNADILTEIGIVKREKLLSAKEIFGADDMAALEFVTEARVKDDDLVEVSLGIQPKEVGEGCSGNASKAASRTLEHWDGIPQISHFSGTKFL